ncbi:cupin domain-containing protein [Hymenobacter sp. GOD-10R]|uniref:cupin domain-containing protein n=1 Tax=Hymenobacter sp. GOD-10R TaxID=3093922 RepID=UPI002D79CB2C|nr:cupin domain-containing protein [Hymenobacter sp. GOD-10R]WRQ26266.1 cupin domain-containing protein [Hymenobacter sp. GOD-10R]
MDATFLVKVSEKDTEGRCVIFDTLRPEKVGPALHKHDNCDEWFQVLEGEFKFQAGEEIMRLKVGDTLLVPRGTAHAFVKTSEGAGRLIVMHQPAARMEEYFRTASKLKDQSVEGRRALAASYGTQFVGPALKPD